MVILERKMPINSKFWPIKYQKKKEIKPTASIYDEIIKHFWFVWPCVYYAELEQKNAQYDYVNYKQYQLHRVVKEEHLKTPLVLAGFLLL